MSKLYYSETGNVIPSLCEELTDYRRARKILHLPSTQSLAQLFILARAYPGSDAPLRISVNGTELPSLKPIAPDIYRWYEVPVAASLLVAGPNCFEFWTDAPAMDAWSLALEDGHRDPASLISTDGGQSWRNEKMGYHHVSRGEYVVRVRLAEGTDPPPPSMIWENYANPRLDRIRDLLPEAALQSGTTLGRVRALTTWVCTSWEYRNTTNAVQYAPWDAETIMAWGRTAQGHNACSPVVMCVHYAVTLTTCCLAAGIPARCAIFTGSINGFNGHFTSEVWFEEFGKWVMVDPMSDAILFDGDVPLSVTEIQQAGSDLSPFVRWGEGHDFQIKNPLIEPWIPSTFLSGVCFQHRSLWPRTDFLSRPELTPSGHGSTSYCETSLVWESKDIQDGFGMFPYFADESYFNAPPPDSIRAAAGARVRLESALSSSTRP